MSTWKDRRRKHWRYRFQYQGENYYGKGYKTERESKAAEAEHRKQLKEKSKKSTVMDFSRLADKYLTFMEKRIASKVYKYKKLVYAEFMKYHGDLPVDEITPDIVDKYLSTRKTNNIYNMHRKDLSALFVYAKNTLKLGITNPCFEIPKLPHTPVKKPTPTEKEILMMIAAATPGDESDILMTCIHCLGRIDEVLRLTWDDVNFDQRSITLWTRKRKNGEYESDVLPMNEDLYAILKNRWEKKKQNKWVFYNEETEDRFFHRPKMMRSICRRAGIKPIGKGMRKIEKGKRKGQKEEFDLYYGFHSLRHFMATYLSDTEKVSLKRISGLLRHKNLKTTEIYLHPVDEAQRVVMSQIEGKFTPKNKNLLTEPSHKKKRNCQKSVTSGKMERATGLEPATSSLGS